MVTFERGAKVSEGKTKVIYDVVGQSDLCIVHSKDRITAGNAARSDVLEGKAAVSNRTSCRVFELLRETGIRTHFVQLLTDTDFVAEKCSMIPMEWVTRRVATGSFLKRNPGVSEGTRFCPPKLEMFFKDDANNDPQWSREQLLEARLQPGGLLVGPDEVDIMSRATVCIFEVLEKAWASLDCCLVDMKIEFGVTAKGELVLADIIDSDSWRLWPSGDRRLMKDKQVYRDMKDVTADGLQAVLKNFQWVLDKLEGISGGVVKGRAVVLMGSPSDDDHCRKIGNQLAELGVPYEIRVSSAHKGTEETLSILARYEGDGVPTIFIAVAGRSNGLGPVLSGNTAYPVVNCPPVSADWGAQDVWSSLRLPSGLGCSTVLAPDAAALAAAQMLALGDHRIWSKLRVRQLNAWIALKRADMASRAKF